MWVKLALEVPTQVNSLHCPWHLKLLNFTQLPSVWVPFSCQQVQTTLRIVNGWVKDNQLFRLVDLQVEFFVIKQKHVLHDHVVVNNFTEVMLWRSQAESIKCDLLRLVILHAIIESKSIFFELKSCFFWGQSHLAKRINCEELIALIFGVISQLDH